MRAKVVNGFVWLIVTDKAEKILQSGLFSLYVLHDSGSESLVEGMFDINFAQMHGLEIGIEVGHLNIV
jgi:hypothetical protein